MDLPMMDELVDATRALLLDLQPTTPMRIQKRETSNESMYALTLSS